MNEIDIVVKAEDESSGGLKSATTNARQFGTTAQEAGHKAAEGQEAFSEKTDRAATSSGTASGAFGALASGVDLVNLKSTQRSQKLDLENQKAATQITNLQAQKTALAADGAARGLSKDQIAAQSKAIDDQVAALQGQTLARNNDIQKISDQQAHWQTFTAVLMAGQLAFDAISGVMDLLTVAQNANTLATIRQKVATVANTIATKAASIATKAWEGAQWLLNAALDANPIGLVVVAVAALVAGIILAYKHSATFRAIVQGAFHGVEVAGRAMWSALKVAFSGISTAARVVANAIAAPFRAAFAGIRSAWNSTVGGRGFSIPGWVPGLGGKGFTIPYLAHGGIASGLALVGEHGPELLDTRSGKVRTNADTSRMMSQGGGQASVTVRFDPASLSGLGRALVETLRAEIRTSGGNVQQALGVPGAA